MVTITTRAAKGSPLTYAEMDANFTALKTAVEALQGGGGIPSYTTFFSDNFSTQTAGDAGGQNGWIDDSGANPKPQILPDGTLQMGTNVGPSLIYRTASVIRPRISALGFFGPNSGVGFGWGYAPGTAHYRVDFNASPTVSVTVVLVGANNSETNVFTSPGGLFTANTPFTFVITPNPTGVDVRIGDQTLSYSETDETRLAVINQSGGLVIRNGQSGNGTRQVDNYLVETLAA